MRIDMRPVLGAEVGLSLVAMQFTAHHSITPELIACDLAISHAVYGRDRLQDQLGVLEPAESEKIWVVTTSLANLASFYLLSSFHHQEGIPIIALLSLAYSNGKGLLKQFKSGFIGLCWAYAIVILPSDSVPVSLFPVYACLYASVSNMADISDIDEDRRDLIRTIPVSFGEKNAYIFSAILSATAIAFHALIDWELGDYFIELVCSSTFLYSCYKGFGKAY